MGAVLSTVAGMNTGSSTPTAPRTALLRPGVLGLAATLLLPAPARGADVVAETLQLDGARLLLSVPLDWAVQPGGAVAVYVEELRPDPRGGTLTGLRYAGDARLLWVGEGVLELALVEGAAPPAAGRVVLGEPRGLPPTPPWAPPPAPAPPPVIEADPLPRAEALADAHRTRERREVALPGLSFDLEGAPLGTVHAAREGGEQAVIAWGGYAADGYGTGAGTAGAAWRLRPERGPALIEIGLESMRGERWAEAEEATEEIAADERYAREAVAGAWLWTRVDTAGLGLAAVMGAGLGVDAEGPALATILGLRTGDPDLDRVELLWEHRGRLGDRLTLDGRVAVSDPLRLGLRARIGDLPRHDADVRQLRADGVLVVAWDPLPNLRWTMAGGLGAYDLLWADAGPVLDGALEVRW